MSKQLQSLNGSNSNSLDGQIEGKLIHLIRSNSKVRNYLHDLVNNADAVDEDLGIILPGIDFTGLEPFQTSSILANIETLRVVFREAAKTLNS